MMLGEPAPLTVTPPPLLALNTAGSPDTDRLSSPAAGIRVSQADAGQRGGDALGDVLRSR